MNNKLNDSRLLECVTAAAVLLIGILTPLSCVIDIVSLFGRSGNHIPRSLSCTMWGCTLTHSLPRRFL